MNGKNAGAPGGNLDVIEVEGHIPREVPEGAIFSITKDQSPFVTHNLFKYPTKFIPEIPRWALEKYGRPGTRVLDPFCGSGTTNVEASLAGYPSVGFDVNPFSVLLARVKTTGFTPAQARQAREHFTGLVAELEKNEGGNAGGEAGKKAGGEAGKKAGGEAGKKAGGEGEAELASLVPALPNLTHWFPEPAIRQLARARAYIETAIPDPVLVDFFRVVLARILRKVSRADEQSPKPYISSKHPKEPAPVGESLRASFEGGLAAMEAFHAAVATPLARFEHLNSIDLTRPPRNPGLPSTAGLPSTPGAPGGTKNTKARHPGAAYHEAFDLVITSPPYINAFDLGRTFKFELYWLDLVTSRPELHAFKRAVLGTEKIPADRVRAAIPPTGHAPLDAIIAAIAIKDPKRAHVVGKFFRDFTGHFQRVREMLVPGGKYVLVIGDSRIRGVRVESAKYLAALARRAGFRERLYFSYVIKKRFLRIPRQGRGGKIKLDRIAVLERAD